MRSRTTNHKRITYAALVCCLLVIPARAQQLIAPADALPEAPGFQAESTPGSLHGKVKDINGAVVLGAKVTLAGTSPPRTILSQADGSFAFVNVPPGPYTLTVNAAGLAISVASGTLKPGESLEVRGFALPIPGSYASVQIVASATEITAAQVSVEEKQRVLGFFPNFYATYIWNASPMTAKQKFGLASKSPVDPVSILSIGVAAGIEQGTNAYSGYGQGAAGYFKRFGAGLADDTFGTYLGGAALPALLHQDPRYFYKGKGSVPARAWYAITRVVICRGDNGKWQPNYSSVAASLATGALGNLYYPASDRHGAGLTITNSLIGTAEGAIGNLFQEFLVRRLTPHVPDYSAVTKP